MWIDIVKIYISFHGFFCVASRFSEYRPVVSVLSSSRISRDPGGMEKKREMGEVGERSDM